MVYETDFYTTRRPYRATPNYSSYTVSSVVPSRQIRILPGIGKVHVVHSYDRIIPYIGHKRLTVVTSHPPHIFRVRPSVIIREIDRIQHKARPFVYFSPTSHYLNSEVKTSDPYCYYTINYPLYPHHLYNYPYYSKLWRDLYWTHFYPKYPAHVWSKNFDDETRVIRAQTNALLKRVTTPVPRIENVLERYPVTTVSRYSYQPEVTYPARVTSDDFVYRMLTPIRNVKNDIYNISHYRSEPFVRRFTGGGLACVKYAGDKAYSRRRNLTVQDIYAMQSEAVRSDIQLLSYYIKANKDRKALESEVPLSATRPSRVFSPKSRMLMLEPSEEIKELREQRAERWAKIHEIEPSVDSTEARIKRAAKQKEEERLAEERALAEERVRQEELAKKEEAARKAELARQEALAAQAAAERAAELERREQAKKEEEARKAEEARIAKEKAEAERKANEKAEAERVAKEKAEAERIAKEKAEAERIAKEKAEAERIAKEKEEAERLVKEKAEAERLAKEKEEEDKRQAELARQEEERQQLLRLEEIARQAEEETEKELARQAAELAELARQELAELAKKEAELVEQEKQEKELSELDKKEREAAEEAKHVEEMAEVKKEFDEIAAAEAATSSDEAQAVVSSEEEVVSSDPEHEPVPVVEEPVTPDVQAPQETSAAVEVEETE